MTDVNTTAKASSIADFPEVVKERFELLLNAAIHGRLALSRSCDSTTGVTSYILCYINGEDNEVLSLAPIGEISSAESPSEAYPCNDGPQGILIGNN